MEYSQPGVVEALSFKLALDFVKYLKKNRVVLSSIRLDFFNRSAHEYKTFDDLAAMEEHFNSYYLPLYVCDVGQIVSIQTFRADSDTYDFPTAYRGYDVSGDSFKLTPLAGFDNQRNSNRDVFKQRQINFITNTVNEYLKFYNEIKYIYDTGIYSPCYAQPGWSQNTWWLKELRQAIIQDNTDRSRFPYRNIRISRRPPE